MDSNVELLSNPFARPDADGVWTVALCGHASYDFVRLKRVFESDTSRHRVVLVDARKLLQCADRDPTDYVLPAVNYWPPGKTRGIRDFLAPGNARTPEMPHVLFATRRRATLLGWLGLEREGVVSFRNGQHRARYLAHAGAVCFPVEVHEIEADGLEAACGYRGAVE